MTPCCCRPAPAAGPCPFSRPPPARTAPPAAAPARGRRAPLFIAAGQAVVTCCCPSPGPASAASEAPGGAGPRASPTRPCARVRRFLPSAHRPTCVERPLRASSRPGVGASRPGRPPGARGERGVRFLKGDQAYALHQVPRTQASCQPSFPARAPVSQVWKLRLFGLCQGEGAEVYPRSCVGCATQSPGRRKKRGAGGARGRKSCSEPGVLDPVGDQGARDPPLLLVAALTDPGLASGC